MCTHVDVPLFQNVPQFSSAHPNSSTITQLILHLASTHHLPQQIKHISSIRVHDRSLVYQIRCSLGVCFYSDNTKPSVLHQNRQSMVHRLIIFGDVVAIVSMGLCQCARKAEKANRRFVGYGSPGPGDGRGTIQDSMHE